MSATIHQAFTTSTLPGVSPLEPSETHQESSLAAARLVPGDYSDTVMSRLFGPRTWFHVEGLISSWLRQRGDDYKRSAWQVYQLDDECGYMAPVLPGPVVLRNGQGQSVTLSPDAAGIAASLMGLAILWTRVPDNAAKALLQDRFADLREFGTRHPEASAIAKAMA